MQATPHDAAATVDRRSLPALIGLIAVGFALRLGYIAATSGLGVSPETHYREHITLATRLLTQGTFGNAITPEDPDPRPTAIFPPLYPLIVAGIYALLGVETYAATLALHALNALATSAAAAVVFSVLSRLGAPPRSAWLAAAATALHPLLIVVTARLWDTSLFVLGATVALWLMVRPGRHPHTARGHFLFGAYLGLLALLNPALTLAYPVLVYGRLSSAPTPPARTRGTLLKAGLCAAAGWAILNVPWTLRNAREMGQFIYVRNGLWQEVWFGVCPEADTGLQAAMKAHYPLQNTAARDRFVALGEVAYVRKCRANALEAIRRDPLRCLRLCGRRALDFWFGTATSFGRMGAEGPQRPKRSRVGVMSTTFLTIETLTALTVAIGFWRKSPHVRRLAGTVFIFSLLYMATHTEIRYRAPIEPMLMILIASATAGSRKASCPA